MKTKILCIVQARKKSIRLPSKVLKKLNLNLYEIIMVRLKNQKK